MKNSFVRTLLCALALASAVTSTAQHNTLSTEETAAGYENMFDGVTALSAKWYGVTGGSQTSFSSTVNPPASWIIATEDSFKVLQVSTGAQNHIATKDTTYRNFDLKVEWKVPSQGNSGIFIRFLKIASWAGASGPEAQVVAVDHSDGQQALHRAGTMYDMFPLRAGQTNWFKPIGQWNEFRIIAYENRVAHYGNGIRLLEYDMNSTAYATAYAASKYRTYPRYKEVHAGSFYLQHHGETGIKYRSMKVKKFTDSTMNPWAPGSPYLKANGTELIDTLPQSATMFANTTAITPAQPRVGTDVSFSRSGSDLLVRFARVADYELEIRDLSGSLVNRFSSTGADHYRIASGDLPHTGLLSISTAGKKVFAGSISAIK
jgi:hypothetical protein